MASSMLTAEVSALASTEADVDAAMKTVLHTCANDPDFALLLLWLTKTDEVPIQLRDMQIKLLRKTRKTVHEKSWESALSKFCFTYSAQDAWEIERFGYKNSSPKVKLRILRELLECQFERNMKFRAKILTVSADSLRSQPIGRDRLGHAYWVTRDNDCNIHIYQEHLDEEIWQVVATNREEFVNLIKRLKGSEVVLPSTDIGIVDEDTSSSSSRLDSEILKKLPPPEEKDDSQEDEQKVPKLSIKLMHSIENKTKDIGKGEEEIADEEDAKLIKKTGNIHENLESDAEEFEEIEEEYEESEEDVDDAEDDLNRSKKNVNVSDKNLNKNSNSAIDQNKKVKPLLISQNKVLNTDNVSTSTNPTRKRAIEEVDTKSPSEYQEMKLIKKQRPSLMDSKRTKSINKYDDNNDAGEEDFEETGDDDEDDVEEEIEEEDIDSVAAEEDENEDKPFDDYDDDDSEEGIVGDEKTDPVMRVIGEGSGKDCDAVNYLLNIDFDSDLNDKTDTSEVIEEEVYYVWGDGYGNECLAGDDKNNDESIKTESVSEAKTNDAKNGDSLDEQNTLNAKMKLEEDKSHNQNCSSKQSDCKDSIETEKSNYDLKLEKNETNPEQKVVNMHVTIEKTPKVQNQLNGENHNYKSPKLDSLIETKTNCIDPNCKTKSLDEKIVEKNAPVVTSLKNSDDKDINIAKTESDDKVTIKQTHAEKMSALESLKKELRESKQKQLEKNAQSTDEHSNTKFANPAMYNRKRRLTDQQTLIVRPSNSESEIDLNTENVDDAPDDQELIEEDVGGKRLKMRPKQTNTELRKKIEAQKFAANDETTSSSGGEEELRRRKKIILSKEHSIPPVFKTRETLNKSEKSGDIVENKETDISTKSNEKAISSSNLDLPQQSSIKKITQSTPTKVKPTLAEIIEKKLKKTPEKNDKDSVVDNLAGMTVKSIFPSPAKSPITKPLKKNLLNQIRQEESDEAAVPRKRTISLETTPALVTDNKKFDTQIAVESKSSVKTEIEKQRTTPERQRKRRSSEETVQKESPEEPEAKKEVIAVKGREITSKQDNTSDVIKEEAIISDSEKNIIKKEITPTPGRRSGRRSVIAPSYVDVIQSKRNRGTTKRSVKKDDDDAKKIEVKEKIESKESEDKPEVVRSTIKTQNDKDIMSDNKRNSKEKETDDVIDSGKNILESSKSENIFKSKTTPTNKTPAKGTRKKREVDTTNILDVDSETPIRQSRRIAQQKIKEEAERRKLEEIALRTMKQELKKKKKAEKQADPSVAPPSEQSSESEESDVETKRKVQKKKCPGKNGNWSSGSEEQEEPDEEDEEPPHYETDPGSPLFRSDHEFSPESEIEDESQVVPMKRARTVRKEDAGDDAVDEEEEEACQKCNKSDHPEWILLCDRCDKGYHCSCLSPVLFYIPEGDWYCPPCQQEQLIIALENQLKEFDNLVENKKKQDEEDKRLAEEKARKEQEEEESKKHKDKRHRMNAKRNKDNSSEEENSRDEDDAEHSSYNSEDSRTQKHSSKSMDRSRLRNMKKNEKRNHRERKHNITRVNRKDSDSGSDSEDSNKSQTTSGIPIQLRDMQIKLLRKTRKT
ncbi:hypothetical protein DOY81_012494, partial [Sarcophaga bullata]